MCAVRPIRLRFAPSPNGYLHLGHAYSALVNANIALQLDGELILRMENIDVMRCNTAFERAIIEDLAWLGLTFDQPFRRQSEHFADYQNALDELFKLGLVYPAFLSRGEVKEKIKAANQKGQKWPHDPDGVPLYPTEERSLPLLKMHRLMDEGTPYSWRLNMDLALKHYGDNLSWQEIDGDTSHKVIAHPELWGDVIVARKEIPTSYHLSVVVDDAEQGISHVVRGKDLFQATSVHCLLQKIFGFKTPFYYHHPLILNKDGNKLSKTNNDTSLRYLREHNVTVTDIIKSLPKI